MKTFGWICFWMGLAVLLIGVPIVIWKFPVLIGKVILASFLNLGLGWKWAHPKQPICDCGHQLAENEHFCTACGIRLR